MPQLVKGGKHAYGWSRVGKDGQIVIPPEALEEYRFQGSDRLILLPGSKTSGGFALGSPETIAGSIFRAALGSHSELMNPRASNGQVIWGDGNPYPLVGLRGGAVEMPAGLLGKCGIYAGDHLLVVRGSRMAVAFAVRGPIVDEARRHPELQVFEAVRRRPYSDVHLMAQP
jgi:hypothetical protein